jgi:soluble lytic murein transglycosylase-like protein
MKPIYLKRSYRKLNRKYWYEKSTGHYPWKWLVIFMALFVIWALINNCVHKTPLVSPVVLNPVKNVYAEAISCENPKGYLECKAYAGEITWKEYDRIYKIIQCESGWNPEAVNIKNKNGSWDRGLVQINSVHKDISNADAFDYEKAIDWMIKKMHKDGNLNAWVCNRKT